MGLDVIAVSQAEFEHGRNNNGWCTPDLFLIHAVEGFEGHLDGNPQGFYRVHGERFAFRAGSYSGYNEWRAHLSLMAQQLPMEALWRTPDEWDYKALIALIDFPDNEGSIGPKTSQRLTLAFEAYRSQAERYARALKSGEAWLEKYGEWHHAFQIASNNGFVIFE